MKKCFSASLLLIALFFATDSSASYRVLGSAHITGGGAGWVAWDCPPPNITCFTCGGGSTLPTAGDKITLTIGPNHYDLVLQSAHVDPDNGGSFTGQLIDGTTYEEIVEEN